MHRLALKQIAIGSALALGSAAAVAADNGITTTISGYGTVAGTLTDDADGGYVTSVQQHVGATNRLDIGLQSRLGLQGVVKFDPEFSFTAQALATRRAEKDYDIGMDWLYGQYTPVSGLDLRLGRMAMPTFLYSDTRNVGYAATWLAAPPEVYAPMPFSTLDGLQGLWRLNVGPATVSTQLSFGNTSSLAWTAIGVLDVKGKDLVSLSVTTEVGDWTVRAAMSQFNTPLSIPVAPGVAIDHNVTDKFMTVGGQYDNGTAIVMTEWARRRQNDVAGIGLPWLPAPPGMWPRAGASAS